jgi:hypothetical protein
MCFDGYGSDDQGSLGVLKAPSPGRFEDEEGSFNGEHLQAYGYPRRRVGLLRDCVQEQASQTL